MLLALISPERSSVLSDLDTQFLKIQPDGFIFTLTKPRKTGDPRSLTTVGLFSGRQHAVSFEMSEGISDGYK